MGLAATSELLELKILVAADADHPFFRVVSTRLLSKPRVSRGKWKGFLLHTLAVKTLSAPDVANKSRTFRHGLP